MKTNTSCEKHDGFYVYCYCDPLKPGLYEYGQYEFDCEPFYIGKGHGKRVKQHIINAKGNYSYVPNKHLMRRIAKILRDAECNPVIIFVAEQLIEKEAYDLEEKLITLIGRRLYKAGPLVNLASGGGVSSGFKHDEEWLRLASLRNSGKNNPMYGSHRAGINNPNFGNIQPPHVRKLMSERKMGQGAKDWLVINPDGQKIIVNNLKQFCETHGLNDSCMISVASGRSLSHWGWKCQRI